MKLTDLPKLFGTAFAENGIKTPISQNTTPGSPAASYNSGFPEITMTELAQGGLPPRGGDFNQILYELAKSAQWAGTGAVYDYNQDFSDKIGGYPKGSVVRGSDGLIYESTIDDNINNVIGGIGWIFLKEDKNTRELWKRSLADIGLTLVDGSFQQGAVVNDINEAVWDIEGHQCYTVSGHIPMEIPKGSYPNSDFVSVESKGLRSELEDGTGELIGVFGGRTLKGKLEDYVSILDFGGSSDGTKDNTEAFNKIIEHLTSTGSKSSIYIPYGKKGRYVYNGAQISPPDGVSIVFESLSTILDASNNENTNQHLIRLTGFRASVSGGYILANPNNRSLMGIRTEYNTELGGVFHMIIDGFNYGIDIDKMWYPLYENIRFRAPLTSANRLTGSHIRIGYYNQSAEVNGLQLNNVHMSEYQGHSISIYCGTQSITMNGGSLETIGGARIKFYTKATRNTLTFNNTYIEGGAIGSPTEDDPYDKSKVYLLEAIDGDTVSATFNQCMFRLGNSESQTEGYLGKNAIFIFNGGFSNSPMVTVGGNNCVANFYGSRDLNFKDGSFQRTTVRNQYPLRGISPPIGFDVLNSTVQKVHNFKTHSTTDYIPVFRVYFSSGSDLKLLNLEIETVVKSIAESYIQGWEKYKIVITTPHASSSPNSGVMVSKIGSDDGGATLLSDSPFSVSFIETNSDNLYVYEISHKIGNPTRLGNVFFSMKGVFYQSGIFTQSKIIQVEKV